MMGHRNDPWLRNTELQTETTCHLSQFPLNIRYICNIGHRLKVANPDSHMPAGSYWKIIAVLLGFALLTGNAALAQEARLKIGRAHV